MIDRIEMATQILPGEWFKAGSGSNCEFDMEPEEIQSVFEVYLPLEATICDFVIFDQVLEGENVAGQTPFFICITDLAKVIREREKLGKTIQVFLRIKSIHSNLDFSNSQRPDAFCSLNGFPLLQRSFGLWPSGCKNLFQHIGKVYNPNTNEFVEHVESRKCFERLRRQFRKFSTPYDHREPKDSKD